MKLPKQLDKEGIEADVLDALTRSTILLSETSDLSVPLLVLSQELRKHIFYAKSIGELIIGFDEIEKELANELQGLAKVGGVSDRISRLLIVTNDGSDRFYKELSFLSKRHGARLLICQLDINSMAMGDVLGLKGRGVKAVMVNRKKSLLNVLKSLIGADS
jgi:hypothetical protein